MESPDRLPADTPIPPVIRTFFASYGRIRATLTGDVEKKGLLRDEFDVVVTLHGSPGMACKAIAARVVAPNPTLTRTLKRMEEKGLVVWQPGPEDRRQKLVSLTPAGEDAYRRTHLPHLRLVNHSVGHLSHEEQVELDRLLRKLTAGFEAESGSDHPVETAPETQPGG
jgi:MarR family transcriptional repressor of emrRAB